MSNEVKTFLDGNSFCVLLGDNIQEGIAGFGDDPLHAMLDFIKNYRDSKKKNV